jgi:hypothetical protein
MVDIDTMPGAAGNKTNEPDDRFEFFVAKYQSDCEPLVERGAKLLAYKAVYDEQRPILLNDQHVASATELAKSIGALVTGKDAEFLVLFKQNTKGLEEVITRIKLLRDRYMEPLVQFDKELRERINSYQKKQLAAARAREEEARQKAAKLAASGKPEDIQKAAEALSAPPVRAGTVKSDHGSTAGFAIKWKIKSIDSDKLPVEFKSPDKAKIEAKLKTMTEEQKKTPGFIPGVIFEEDLQTRLT